MIKVKPMTAAEFMDQCDDTGCPMGPTFARRILAALHKLERLTEAVELTKRFLVLGNDLAIRWERVGNGWAVCEYRNGSWLAVKQRPLHPTALDAIWAAWAEKVFVERDENERD